MAEAGAFAVVLEKRPEALARLITEQVAIPTIGIGASPACDGQILVVDDMLGLFGTFRPRFVKRYAALGSDAEAAIAAYAKDAGRSRMSTAIVRIVSELRSIVAAWRREGLRIAVVPTMGALHAGHLSLVRAALAKADRVIVTLFGNPTQFNNAADLAAYPRTEHDDAAKLASVGTHILYAPNAADMYPPGFATTVSTGGVSDGLCGTFRPGHFDGVATVVTKLLLQTGADLAFFGRGFSAASGCAPACP